MTKKRNVVFFFTDDQRFDTIHALGNSEISTPNIDELVKRGTSFTQAHIPGGTVGAVCMPSRAMLNTGRNLFHLNEDGKSIPAHHTLLGETFQAAGYRTFGTGKWHNGTESYARSFTDGAEIFFGGMQDHWNVPAYDFDPTGKYENRCKQVSNYYYSNNTITNICDHSTPGKHSSELFCDAASEWIDAYNAEDPFYMYISFMAPHDPRTMPKEFLTMYNPQTIRLPENFCEEHPFDFGVRDIRDEVLARYPRTKAEVKKHIAEYYGMISHLDNELGKVITSLKKAGKYDDTIIIFAADNGLALGQHGLMGKQSAYEHSVRVPLIFAGPDIPKGEKREAYVYLLDIYPTLCDLLGLEIPETVEGKSFIKCFEDEKVTVRDTMYFAYAELVRAVKDEQFKLIEYRGESGHQCQLFDLKNDPLEMNNLYGKSEYAQVVKRLEKAMKSHKEELDDELHPTGKAFWNKKVKAKDAGCNL